ncbi:MAG TPA: RNA polymerase sigma factor [Phaeodactylibacter sp.]|nr:RNA polymerase sigma factor [Phaeodactylibacter sp.]
MGERKPEEYLQALCRGDNALVKEIYVQFLPNISRWVRKNNGSEQDAEDLFQEALIAVFDRYCGENSPEFTSSFGALLFSICRNIWYSRLSEKKREEQIRFSEKERYESEADTPDLLIQAEEAVAAHRERELLDQSFKQLSELCQKVLWMMAQGKAGEDIAKELGMNNRSTVYVRAHKCKKRWRSLFEKLR